MPAVSNITEQLSLTAMVSKRRLLKITAAVAQEEVAQEDATAAAEEEGEGEGEGEGDHQEVEEVAEPVIVQSTKLYFGNLPYNCDSAQLAGIIQEYASPEMVEVLYDRDTGRSRGFAFVTMSSVEDCEAVIQNLDGSQYGGRTLRVNFSDKPKPKEPLYPESDYKLFVGNLSWSVTSESLTEVFQEYGNVVGARVLYDGDTGRSRGYGFVCYSSKQEMDAALESLNGAELEGRGMRISLALGKKN
ncbi:uncharacterized protein A4U43_C07F19940 [Asparagus officinalis]|uniref:RRM domain-containing protein n=1 Tax=Asparagus officinalis TaxID=4686 RepID=A0A5P1EDB4_ASPOF|nr:31 kDa ribonucleoprotein, chloroplastic [Asparagus officinalis]ONK63886.1 uncharacterized protein A4U43_C07F19940 [Asparagus officinalis]